MKAREMREKSTEELSENLEEAQKRRFFQMKMQRATGEGLKPHEMSQIGREIARIKTVLRQRQLQEESARAPEAAEGAAP